MGVQVPLSAPRIIMFGAFSACPKNHNFANLYAKGMKNLRLLFGVCLGVLALRGAHGVDYEDVVRAASRSGATNVSTATPLRGANTITQSQKSSNTTTRSGTTNARTASTPATTEPRSATKNVAARSTTAANVVTRANTATRTTGATVTARTAKPATTARTARQSRLATPVSRSGARTATARTGRMTSRVATNESPVLNTNYTRCREIYYECMDEFCANKDANLRRCACSSRANEFENVKKNLANFEDKMLNFNQRLLLVNMDAEDVDAINTATEGEDAFYNTTDKTKSKKALDEIAKKLNTTFGDDSAGVSLAPISLSLNIDSAFDTVDSFMGSDTTSKSGTALYNAAIPICRETAMEVCTEDELSLAISGYLMLMEQDCNTVQKAYQAQVDTAHSKVFESSALLDMSRLDAYQTRNSDDILTCKRKMMDMLTNTTVCGANMEKCLDMTGKYIDPSTGTAFLTPNLSELGSLITRPDVNQSWTSANGVGKFITYLKNKKQYLEPAMKNCQDIADTVWDAFIEDALAQIKLAQDAKLEEIRQACTTLTSECLTSAYDSIGEFDARALSVFGVMADRTAKAMCADVSNSCTALMGANGDTEWESGVSAVTTAKTYDTIVSSCTQVGRNCVIQSCRSISGNFDLCDDINYSPNRHAILERTACWPEVLSCVAAAGNDAILDIMTSLGKGPRDDFYSDLKYYNYYANDTTPLEDICARDGYCASGSNDTECATCRIAERIWGNCEDVPTNTIQGDTAPHNRIYMPKVKNDTILSWFAINTGTARPDGTSSDDRSCVNTRCTTDTYLPSHLGPDHTICVPEGDYSNDVTDDGLYCPTTYGVPMTITTSPRLTNCCFKPTNWWNHEPMGGNACCETGNVRTIPGTNEKICMPTNVTKMTELATNGTKKIICIGADGLTGSDTAVENFPSGDQVRCNGTFIIVDGNKYTEPSRPISTGTGGIQYTPKMVYYNEPTGNQSAHDPDTEQTATPGTHQSWFIKYQ